MVGRLLGLLVLLAALASAAAGQGASRLRIVTSKGPVDSPFRVFFGSAHAFYAVAAGGDQLAPDFRPAHALDGVDWRLHRLDDMRNVRDAATHHPGREIRHRKAPEQRQWGRPGPPFILPTDLVAPLSSGRYVLRATHPIHGEDTLALTVVSILLIGYADEHTAGAYAAGFRIAVVDPDLTEPTTPMVVETVDKNGRRLDGLTGVRLARSGRVYLSPKRIRISSSAPRPGPARRGREPRDPRRHTLHIQRDGSLRLTFGRRVFEFPLPLAEGPLVLSRSTVIPGREARHRPVSEGRFGGNERPTRPRVPPPLHPDTPPKTPFDIVTSAGRGRRIKVWVGEPIAFAARARPRGPADLFEPTRWLRDVLWTLTRVSTPLDTSSVCIIPGTQRVEMARVGPEGLWGDPAALFRYPNDLATPWTPGRYLLRAERASGVAAEIRLDVAALEFVDVRARLGRARYRAALRLRLTDPSETRNVIPVRVEIVSEAGDVMDYLRGVLLARDQVRPGIFRSQKLLVDSRVKAPCCARYEETDPMRAIKLSTTPHVLKIHPSSSLRVTLDGVVFSFPMPLMVYETLLPNEGSLGAGGGK
jgi:hypothetical protein